MEFSDHLNTDNLSRKERLRIAGVRTILDGLVDKPAELPLKSLDEFYIQDPYVVDL